MKPETVKKILDETKKNFDKIAEEFSRTREKHWEIMKSFLAYIKEGDKILDIGCGNGRLYDLIREKNVEYIGVDNSEKLIEIAKKRFPVSNFQPQKFIVADALALPFQNEEFNNVFMIAFLPHLPSRELQEKAIYEAYRVLKKEGNIFITCWNLFQPKLFFKNLIYRLKNQKLYRDLSFKDYFIPWHLSSGEIIQRFYHAFTKKELRKILEKIGFKIKDIYYEYKGKKSNWLKGLNLVVIAKK